MKADPAVVRELYDRGLSQSKIAIELGCSRSLIDLVMRSNNIRARSLSDACPNKVDISNKTRDKVIECYLDGMPIDNILAINNITYKIMSRLIKIHRRTISESNLNITRRNKHVLTQNQLDIMYGTLLGDASLSVDGHSLCYRVCHCDRQSGYVDHIHSIIGYGSRCRSIQKSGFSIGSTVHSLCYRNKGALQDIFDNVMINGKKMVNVKWMDHLTPESIAYWFMDDGSSVWVGRRNKYSCVRVTLATYSFTMPEVCLLSDKLRDYGFKFYINHHRKERHDLGYGMRLCQTQSGDFMDFIRPTLLTVPCMNYKLKYAKSISIDSLQHKV